MKKTLLAFVALLMLSNVVAIVLEILHSREAVELWLMVHGLLAALVVLAYIPWHLVQQLGASEPREGLKSQVQSFAPPRIRGLRYDEPLSRPPDPFLTPGHPAYDLVFFSLFDPSQSSACRDGSGICSENNTNG